MIVVIIEKLNIDPTESNTEKVKSPINSYEEAEQISSTLANSLLPDKIKTSAFHLLPKIHILNNPGRTAISSVDCHTCRILIITYSQQ